jgi:hypothetical protein
VVLDSGLHANRRYVPKGLLQVELLSHGAGYHLSCSGRRQDYELQGHGSHALLATEGSGEFTDLGMGHGRIVLLVLHLARLRQDVVQVGAPTGWMVAQIAAHGGIRATVGAYHCSKWFLENGGLRESRKEAWNPMEKQGVSILEILSWNRILECLC